MKVTRYCLLALFCIPILMPVLSARRAFAAADDATAYQINPAHIGAVTTTGMTPPLRRLWSVDLSNGLSYPLIAGGKVFVIAGSGSTSGAMLYAFDGATGAAAWPAQSLHAGGWLAATYDGGRIFVVNSGGYLSAFDAATGSPLWGEQLPGQYAFSAPPTASAGVVYVGGAGSGGTLYAVAEASGSIKWRVPVMNGDLSSPAVSSSGVYVSYAGPQTYDFSLTGSPLWHYNSGIEGGGGKTAALYNGLLYARDGGTFVFDALTGAQRPQDGVTDGVRIPAFDAGRAFTSGGSGTVTGIDLSTGAQLWTFNAGDPTYGGDGIVTAPLVVSGTVYVGSVLGNLYGLDPATGAKVWSDNIGDTIDAPDEQNVHQPLTGMAAGDGLLVVSGTHDLVAYAGAGAGWTAVSTAAGADGTTRLLWNRPDGSASFWTVGASGGTAYSPVYGPYSGWTARRVAVGAGGASQIFWVNTDGQASFWTVSAGGAVSYSPIYGPYTGWTPTDFSATSDGSLRILWKRADGAASFWSVGSGGGVTYGPIYGPYAGWSATHIAAFSGGTEILWNNASGAASYWTVGQDGAIRYSPTFGPFNGWTATGIGVGSDGKTRLQWDNGTMTSFWTVDSAGNASFSPVWGPFSGWTPTDFAVAPDGSIRFLWDNVSGAVSFWNVAPGYGTAYSSVFGPF